MKPNAKLSRLLIRDLAQFSGQTFTYPDRLTRAEAQQVELWARGNPEVVKAFLDKGHPENSSVRLFAETVRYFQAEHPQGPAGEALAWPAPSEDDLRAVQENIFGVKTAAEAEALLAWAQTRPEYRDAYLDKAHPQHKDYVEQTQALLSIVHPAPPGEAEPPAPGAAPVAAIPARGERRSPLQADPAAVLRAQRARIADLQRDPAYIDRNHPGHKAAVAAVTRAYEAAYPAPEPPGAPVSSPAPAGTVKPGAGVQPSPDGASIAALQREAAYTDARHPGHNAAVEAVQQAYQRAYPEPAAEPAPSGNVAS